MERAIIVSGTAEIRILPDRALVLVTVDADAGSRDDAYRRAAGTASAVDVVLDHHAGEIERVVTAALTVQPLTRWRKGEVVRTGWRASRRTEVEVTGFEGLGLLLSELTGAGATIDGPTWRVDDTNEAYDRVRQLAAQDARRRAEAYASGLGVPLGAINWMAEPGLRSSSGEPTHRIMTLASAARMDGAVEDELVIEVTPADSIIEAAIEVSFSILEPG